MYQVFEHDGLHHSIPDATQENGTAGDVLFKRPAVWRMSCLPIIRSWTLGFRSHAQRMLSRTMPTTWLSSQYATFISCSTMYWLWPTEKLRRNSMGARKNDPWYLLGPVLCKTLYFLERCNIRYNPLAGESVTKLTVAIFGVNLNENRRRRHWLSVSKSIALESKVRKPTCIGKTVAAAFSFPCSDIGERYRSLVRLGSMAGNSAERRRMELMELPPTTQIG